MLYILLPVYNEEKSVVDLINSIVKTLGNKDFRIVIINDGSNDRTYELISANKRKFLDIISYPVNANIGSVFSTGIEYILNKGNESDSMIIMESDGTSSPIHINNIIYKLNKGFDICIASRFQKGGGYKNFPLNRLLFSKCASFLMKKLFPIKNVLDYTIFYRGYNLGILKKAVNIYSSHGLIRGIGFVANAELLIRLSFIGAKCTEIPFIYNYKNKKSRSKMSVIQTLLEYLVTLLFLRSVRNSVFTKKLNF